MLTANRIHQFVNSALDWEELIRRQMQRAQPPKGPRVAISETTVLLEFDLPGIQRDALDVEVIKNSLTVTVNQTAGSDSDGAWKLQERPENGTSFEFSFPFNIDAERTELELQNGVLKIKLQKPAEESPRKLQVN